ncbi:MAG TPA: family 20 glycosylhydrolase [archaeon]|nr:family 20 glycosylhydrolase [archaeon]
MLCSSVDSGASPSGKVLEVLPQPAEFIPSDLSLAVTENTMLLLCQGAGEEDLFAAQELNAWLEELGFSQLAVKTLEAGARAPSGSILVGPPVPGGPVMEFLERLGVRDSDVSVGDEGYLIGVGGDGAGVAARSAAGRFYGLMTLAQMFFTSGRLTWLQGGILSDRPALALRGISDDISRGQVSTLEDLKKIVRFLARYKMNVYMPYLEDMFTFKSHSDFGDGRGALTPQEVQELEKFARRLHVRIIPIFQTLGHYENLLIEDKYRHIAEFPGAHTLSPAADDTYRFLRDVLGEIVPAFSDPYFHIACDESWDVGQGKSRELTRKLGASGVHAAHYRKVYDMVTGLRRRVMMYGDIILNHPAIMEKIPKDIVIVDWHYSGTSYPSVAKFRKAGFDVVVSPSVRNYNRLYPDYGSALSNIEILTRTGLENGALGSVTSSWCDNGAVNFRQHNLWGYAFAADYSWNARGKDCLAVERIFWKEFFAVSDPEPFVELNRLLVSTLGRGFTLYDWWRHPLMGPSQDGSVGKTGDLSRRGREIVQDSRAAREILAQAGPLVRANRWYLGILSYEADAAACLGQKYLWMGEYAETDGSGALGSEKALSLAQGAGDMRQAYSRLKERFSELWLEYNKPEGLENNLRLFARQLELWKRIESALLGGARPSETEIPSAWIAPRGSGGSPTLKKMRSAFFRKEINIDAAGPLSHAVIQLMGMSHAEAFLNGKPVGETIGRRSLSLIVESQRARVFDISGLLKPGENILAVKVTNYEGKVPALNIYGEINGRMAQEILTGTSLRGIETDSEPAGWKQAGPAASEWKPCETCDVGLPVSAPMLDAGFNSRIER